MEFFSTIIATTKFGPTVKAAFQTRPSSDFMVRGGGFYAIYDDERGLWSTNEYDVERIVDAELMKVKNGLGEGYRVSLLKDSTSGAWTEYKTWLKSQPDNWAQLDQSLAFDDTPLTIRSLASKKLPYSLVDTEPVAWNTLVGKLYSHSEKEKIEWAIGAIASGDSRWIQKFMVLFGGPGSGKSTILKIVAKLFDGYCKPFSAGALASRSDQFALEAFREDPLVALDDEGDLRKIETNGTINSITSHATILVNEKHRNRYPMTIHSFLMIATNNPVKITDAKSGLIRRLIDVVPTGMTFQANEYYSLLGQIDFEKGAIVKQCLDVYSKLGSRYYDAYRPMTMMYSTDSFFNFVEDHRPIFEEQGYVTLAQAYKLYKEYFEESGLEFKLPKYRFREALKDYFKDFRPFAKVDGVSCRSVYFGFKTDAFDSQSAHGPDEPAMKFSETTSTFDIEMSDCLAQYASDYGTPLVAWSAVTTTLKNLDTTVMHYILPPVGLVTIDFDLKDSTGAKSAELNLEAASKFPPTYGEFSKGGEGVHLEYWYDGDLTQLETNIAPGIEVKFRKDSDSLWALRRRHSFSNGLPIAHISEGLPLKEKKPMVDTNVIQTEKGLRALIMKALRKEVNGCAYTAPAVQFIKKILDEAYDSGMTYDVEDLHLMILNFAIKSTHQANNCAKLVSQMKFVSKEEPVDLAFCDDSPYVFFDVEVFPNLFIVCCKTLNNDVHKFINPSATVIEGLSKKNLIGFNNRRYDNHILYGRMLGFTNYQLYDLSRRIIDGDKTAFFRDAYSLSYTDIYDFSTVKQSLKKFEIDLGIHHQELGLMWDEEVPEELWSVVADYCANDVIATEATFIARKEDWNARLLLSQLSGLTPNDITSAHMARILFGDDPRPQDKFVYTDLSTIFPKYKFVDGKTYYNGKEYGEGGLAVSQPGIYTNVWLLDIASMHPTSLIQLNYFGPYTNRFAEIVNARLAVKHNDQEALRTLLGGALIPYLGSSEDMKNLAQALKIVINQTYGLTSAKFDNKFRDPRNVDNIVAKRGELFMLSLLEQLNEWDWCHVKTDSIKLPNPLPSKVDFVVEYGKKFGYIFEHEMTFERLALVDKANYVGKGSWGKHEGEWTATGLMFSRPYPFKYLFSGEPISINDMAETMGVHTGRGIYKLSEEKVNTNPDLLKEAYDVTVASTKEWQQNLQYVGRIGKFTPVVPGSGGYILLRESRGSFSALSGTKGYLWIETEQLKTLQELPMVDESYYRKQVEECMEAIAKVSYKNEPDAHAITNMFITGDVDVLDTELSPFLPF